MHCSKSKHEIQYAPSQRGVQKLPPTPQKSFQFSKINLRIAFTLLVYLLNTQRKGKTMCTTDIDKVTDQKLCAYGDAWYEGFCAYKLLVCSGYHLSIPEEQIKTRAVESLSEATLKGSIKDGLSHPYLEGFGIEFATAQTIHQRDRNVDDYDTSVVLAMSEDAEGVAIDDGRLSHWTTLSAGYNGCFNLQQGA